MLGDHQVRERAWLTVVEGEVEVSCGDVTATAGTGTLLMFDPAERHSVSSAAGARLLLLLAPWPGDGHYGEDETSAQVSPRGLTAPADAGDEVRYWLPRRFCCWRQTTRSMK